MTVVSLASIALSLALIQPTPEPASPAQDWVIKAGSDVEYDTARGPLVVGRLHIEAGASLRVVGPHAFSLVASESVQIDGLLDLSGQDSWGVTTLNTTNQPERGALGGPGGGRGGTGSQQTSMSTDSGTPGLDGNGQLSGGGGGESSYSDLGKNARRGAGGGGGVLAAAQPAHPDPFNLENAGLVPTPGWPGGPLGLGAISQSQQAQGGSTGQPVFIDADDRNDWWGRKLTMNGLVSGELTQPLGGQGGGGGGDAVGSASFPLIPFSPYGDEKGSGGGGGGGLGMVLTHELILGPAGRIKIDGGDGGGGENTMFLDRVGGGSGGGSGGMLVLQARLFDFAQAQPDAITARGGTAGTGKNDLYFDIGAGGHGGPGLLQLHTPDGSTDAILLPAGVSLDELTLPNAHVLLPVL